MIMRHVCLIEDSPDLQAMIRLQLDSWYRVSVAGTLAEARKLLNAEKFDLILLDVNLPDGNGFEFCAELKSHKTTQDIPLIFLTGKNEPLDKMMGFKLGADDYIVKPFEPIEVRARIEARMKKAVAPITSPTLASFNAGPLRFDTLKQRVYVRMDDASERDAGLTPLEYKLLHCLVRNKDRVYNRVELMKAIQEPGVHVNEDNVYTHISAVRRKLGDQAEVVDCIPRVGYRFVIPTRKVA